MSLSIADLDNGKANLDTINAVVTSNAPTVVDRLGNTKVTLAGAIAELKTYTNRGVWATGTAYAVKDIISSGGTWYVCVQNHISGSNFAADQASNWRIYQGLTSADLAGSAGAGKIGQDFSAAYLPGTVGYKLALQVSPEDFGAVGDGVADDTASLRNAIAFCLSNGVRQLKSRRAFALSGTVDISNFSYGFELELGAVVAHPSFSAPANWKTATPLLSTGAVGGGQVGLVIRVDYLNGGGKADGLLNTANGAGGSHFHFTRAESCGIVVKHDSNTAPTASNKITGHYWTGNLMGAFTRGVGSVCEGTIFDVGFVAGNKYGGLVFGDRTQYAHVDGTQLDFNGAWLSEHKVASIVGFNVGNTVTAGGKSAEVLAAYWHQGLQYLLLIETKDVTGSNSNFPVGSALTNGSATQVTIGRRTCNENGSAFYFDIVLALTPGVASFWRGFVTAPYLGGIAGSMIWDAQVRSGNSNSSTTSWGPGGLFATNSGSTLALGDKRSSDVSFMDVNDDLIGFKRRVYMGANQLFGNEQGTNVPAATATVVATMTAGGVNGAAWEFALHDPGTSGIFARGVVRVAANASTAILMLYGAAANCTVAMSGLNLVLTQGTGAARVIYTSWLRLI